MPPRLPALPVRTRTLKDAFLLQHKASFSITLGCCAGRSNPSLGLLDALDTRENTTRPDTIKSSRSAFNANELISALKPHMSARNITPNRQSMSREEKQARDRQRVLEEMAAATKLRDMERQITRPFRPGDVYGPHDLSPVEMMKWKAAARPKLARAIANTSKGPRDVFDTLNINPIKHYKNYAMMGEFVTEMGRIKHGRLTGLRPVNQRRMAKAVRRAVGIGIMPSVYRHPELWAERVEQRHSSMR